MDKNNLGVDLSNIVKNHDKNRGLEKMGGQNFDRLNTRISRISRITRLIMKYSGGLVKNETQADYVILGIILIIFIFSIFLFPSSHNGSKKISVEALKQVEQMPINNFIEPN